MTNKITPKKFAQVAQEIFSNASGSGYHINGRDLTDAECRLYDSAFDVSLAEAKDMADDGDMITLYSEYSSDATDAVAEYLGERGFALVNS